MRKILLLFIGIISCLSLYSQHTTLGSINRASEEQKDAMNPIKGEKYKYAVYVTKGNDGAYYNASIEVTNGTINDSQKTSYINQGVVGTRIDFYVKWNDNSDTGSIKVSIGSRDNQTVSSNFKLTTRGIKIAGPSTIKYGSTQDYTITGVVGDIKVNSVSVSTGSALRIVNSSTSNPVKITPAKNESNNSESWIKATAYTSHGTFTTEVRVNIDPEFKVTPNGDCLVCNNNTMTFSVPVLSGATITWTAVDKFTLVSGQGTGTATFKATGNGGYGKVKAVMRYNGKDYTNENSDVWVGTPAQPDVPDFAIYDKFFSNLSYTFKIFCSGTYNDPDNTGFHVEVNNNAQVVSFPSHSFVQIKMKKITRPSYFNMTINGYNKCGAGPSRTYSGALEVQDGPGIITRSANTIRVNSINVYDLTGRLVYTDNNVLGNFDLKTTSLVNGIYIIQKSDGENTTSEKVILKR